MTFVAESLIANSDGTCPDCGTLTVVDQLIGNGGGVGQPTFGRENRRRKRNLKTGDLPLAVRCRLQIQKVNVESLDELLQCRMDAVSQRLAGTPGLLDQLQTMLDKHGLEWEA